MPMASGNTVYTQLTENRLYCKLTTVNVIANIIQLIQLNTEVDDKGYTVVTYTYPK